MPRKKKVEVISTKNKKVSNDLTEKEKEIIPEGFNPIPMPTKKAENEMKILNGRIYKELPGKRGIWADTGEIFDLGE